MSAQEWSPMEEEPKGECTGPFAGVAGREVWFGGFGSSLHSGSNLGGVGPERGLRGGGRRGWCEEWARSG
jgi:hypothetical protein